MSEASPRRRRSSKRESPSDRSARMSLIGRSPKPRKKASSKVLPRCASEPELWIVQFVPDDIVPESDKEEDPPLVINPTFYSCYDVLEPSSHEAQAASRMLDPSEEEKKVLVSVTVEGSVGPIKVLVRLGASVEEAINTVLQKYRNEGRSPRLDTAVASSFQLHYSHFSLECLDKSEKIGEVGGRSFYLRTNCETMGSFSGTGGNLVVNRSNDILSSLLTQTINTSQLLMSFIIKKFDKIKRRTFRLWRLVTCANCM